MRLRLDSSRVKSSAVGQLRTVDFFAATFSLYSYNVHHNHIRTHKTVQQQAVISVRVPNSSHHLVHCSLWWRARQRLGVHVCVAHTVSCATRAQ